MFSYIWPVALVVFSNTIYQICAKSVPSTVSPYAALTVTYLVGAVCTAILHFVFNPQLNIFKEIPKLNWSSYLLGLAIVGLEVGWIYAYKAGWQVSTASIVQSAALAVMLVAVGYFLFHEEINRNKIIGVVICLVGLVFLNLK